jgi:hypothetical protein
MRCIAALIEAANGAPARRHNLRNHYAKEPSPYVPSAILFSAKYFPISERKTCLSSWKGHSKLNGLLAEAVSAIV